MAPHLHIAYNSSITQQKGPIPCWHTHWLRKGGRWGETKRQKDCVVTNCGRKQVAHVCAHQFVCACVCMKCSKVNLMSRWAPQFLPSVLMSCYYCLLLWAQTDWDVTADIRYLTLTCAVRDAHSGRQILTRGMTDRQQERMKFCVCVHACVEACVLFWRRGWSHRQHFYLERIDTILYTFLSL